MAGLCKEEREEYTRILSEYPKLRKFLLRGELEDSTSLTIQFEGLDQRKLEELMKRTPKIKTSYNYFGEGSVNTIRYYTINKYNKLLEIGMPEESLLTTFSTFNNPGVCRKGKGKTLGDDYKENAEDIVVIIEVKTKLSQENAKEIIVYGNKEKLKANNEIPAERWEFDDFITDLKRDLRREYEETGDGINITEEREGIINKKSIDELINNWGDGERYCVLKLYVQQNGKIKMIDPLLPLFRWGASQEEICSIRKHIKEQREDVRRIIEKDPTTAAAYLLPTFYIESQSGCGVKKSNYTATLNILRKNSK